jgi:N-dimethylarginine dimethylaminohydrolase
MCPPTHFRVEYSTNPWMDPTKPVCTDLAVAQWEQLRELYLSLGHTVDLIEAREDLPDMVFAANGATVVDGRVMVARFRYPQRAGESAAYLDWFRAAGFGEVRQATWANEGEGDYLVAGDWVLAGTGLRSDARAHRELQEYFGRPVVGLDLVDPRYYHLDTALAVLDGSQIMYNPAAFSPGSEAILRRLFPDAVLATEADAAVFGLNAASDGRHVVLAQAATNLAAELRRRGFEPIGVDLSELLKSGGGVKCCTLELGSATPQGLSRQERE